MEINTINCVYELVDEIKNSSDYLRYKLLDSLIMEKYPEEIKNFNELKEKYNKALEFGKYYPNYNKIKNEFFESKNELYGKDLMIEYKSLEMKLEFLLKEISQRINSAVRETIW